MRNSERGKFMTAEKWMDTTLTSKERAKVLLARLNVQEKVGQLNEKLYGFRIFERKKTEDGETVEFSKEFYEEVEKSQGLGVLYGLYRADPWADKNYETGLSGRLARETYNKIQKYLIEHSRFGIPMMMSSECPHGHQALDGYLLPVNLAAGATFHPELLKKGYETCARQLKEMGVQMALVSMLDVLRDPRWGRSEECYGEDPYLASRMAEAAVKGIQEQGVICVAKHFAAQGEGTGGVNASAARIGERELREIHLPPMKACASAGAGGVMAAYNEIDGIYCHVNKKLLTKILREEIGFDGTVMSDGCAIDQLDEMTGDNVVSQALALKAGVDIGLWGNAFDSLDKALERGLITEEELDQAVLRVLTQKFETGLFENPYLEEDKEFSHFDYETETASLEIARESAVLLKNDEGVLPFSEKIKKIAVVGPNADAVYHQLGDYTPPVKIEDTYTPLKGIRKIFGEENVLYAQGSFLREENEILLKEAEKVCEQSDAVVCVLGGSSSRFGEVTFMDNGAAVSGNGNAMDCGEGMDVADLNIPKAQLSLLKKVKKIGKPVVVIVIAGRPLAVKKAVKLSDALIYSFYPGPVGGLALAEILKGIVNPSGRLPASLPESSGQLPVYYNYKASYRAVKYMDKQEGPLYSFGYGLDYTDYAYEDIGLNKTEIFMEELFEPQNAENGNQEEKEGAIKVRFRVTNTGDREGFAVPLLYVTDVAASTVRRVKELKDFKKVLLAPGESKEVELTLSGEDLSLYNEEMEFVAEPGKFILELSDKGKSIWKGELILCTSYQHHKN